MEAEAAVELAAAATKESAAAKKALEAAQKALEEAESAGVEAYDDAKMKELGYGAHVPHRPKASAARSALDKLNEL